MRKLLILMICLFPIRVFGLAAFPGAEGFGAVTRGAYELAPGTTPTVYRVTNTNDTGTGSFRDAVTSSGARIVIFDTGGTVTLTSTVNITNPYLTIAGQTAPGNGICFRGAAIVIATHDVIVRGIRLRVGRDQGQEDGLLLNGSSNPVYDVIVDHSSFTWAGDENTSHYDNVHDVTWSWNIISEGLNYNLHGFGQLLGSATGSPDGDNLSVHHNLMSSQRERMSLLQNTTETEFINNVIYNWQNRGTQNYANYVDLVGNYYKSGPCQTSDRAVWCESGVNEHVYVSGNIGPNRPTDSGPEWDITDGNCDAGDQELSSQVRSVTHAVTVSSPTDAYSAVLASTGAGAIIPSRDSVDARIVSEATNGTGNCVDDEDDVGGYPTLSAGSPWTDTDSDGIPDSWETAQFGDLDQDETTDYDSDGYYDLEEWINSFYPQTISDIRGITIN